MVTINNVQVNFTTSEITFLQGCDMNIFNLQDTFRAIEQTDEGLMQPIKQIIKASGNEDFNIDGSSKNALTITILPPYTMTFEFGATPFATAEGNLLGQFVNMSVQINNAVGAVNLNSDAIEYSSYQNGVWLNATTSNTGSEFPTGTREFPVNNIDDALLIAGLKGFDTINIIGNLTINSSADLSNMTLRGANPVTSVLTMETGAITNNTYIQDLYFQGVLDNNIILRDCSLGPITHFDGHAEHCAFTSTTYYINGLGMFINCFAGPTCGLNPPVFDLTNASGLGMRNITSSAKVINKTATVSCEVNGIDGAFIIDSSVANGVFTIYGSGYVVNESTGSAVVYDRTTGTPQETAEAVAALSEGVLTDEQNDVLMLTKYQNKAVYIDTEAIINGDGSAISPFNNVADTTDFAEANGITVVYIYSDVTIDRNVKNFTCIGIGTPVVDCAGHDLKNTEFTGVELRGTYTDTIKAEKCVLGNNFELNGGFKDCGIVNNLICIDGGKVTLKGCFSNIGNQGVTNLSLNGSGSSEVSIVDFGHDLVISDVNNALDLVKISMPNSNLTLDSSCTSGNISIAGHPKLTDNSNGTNVDTSALINPATRKEVIASILAFG